MSEFVWPVRVYFEDTDAGGIVYHAQYLNFMERARTEWLRYHQFEQQALLQSDVQLVVSSLSCRYLRPAVLDDALDIVVSVSALGACRMTFRQQVMRSGELLCEASVDIACIGASSQRPQRWPGAMRDVLEREINS